MIATTPTKDYLAYRSSPSCRPRHCTPPRRVSPSTDLSSYDSPMLTPSPLRQRPLFPNPFNPVLADPDDLFLQSPFKSPAQAHNLHTQYTTKPQTIAQDDDEGSIFLASPSSPFSPFFPASASQPLLTPVKQIHRLPSRSALSITQPKSMHAPLDIPTSATRVGVGTKRKSTPHASTPIRQHNLTPLVISTHRMNSDSTSDAVMLDRLAPLPAPKFVASTPQTKAETDAHLRRQTATLTRLKLSDFVEFGEGSEAIEDDSGCDMGDDDHLFSGSPLPKLACKIKGKEKEEVAEAISPGGHIIKRRARRRPLSAELLESARSLASPSKISMVSTTSNTLPQQQRNPGIVFPSAPHLRKRTTSGSSSSDAGSPVPRRRISNGRPCPPKLTSTLQTTSSRHMNRQDSATLFFGPAIPSNSVPATRSRLNSSLSSSASISHKATRATKAANRHSYAGPGGSHNNLNVWNTIQTRDPSPSPKSSPPAIAGDRYCTQEDYEQDIFFGGTPQESSFIFSVTEGTPSPTTKRMSTTTLPRKYKPPRDSGIELSDDDDMPGDYLNIMPGASTSIGSIQSDAEDNLVTPGFGPEAGSGWPSVFVSGTDDAGSEEKLDVDAFIMRTLAAASKGQEGKKKIPGTPVKKVKTTYLPGGARPWQSAVAAKVGPRFDFEGAKKGKVPRQSLPAAFPPMGKLGRKSTKLSLDQDTESDDDDDSPGKRGNYAGLGIGRPSASSSTPHDGNPLNFRARWLMRRSSSGAFSSGSESISSLGTPTRANGKGFQRALDCEISF
ncbi:hypothetical protein H0H87_005211 [Tephrocybe sp. NHM501043]|nr:hypothetical protein H0H87_005211 [Tephrocybe sp. NHM501043]